MRRKMTGQGFDSREYYTICIKGQELDMSKIHSPETILYVCQELASLGHDPVVRRTTVYGSTLASSIKIHAEQDMLTIAMLENIVAEGNTLPDIKRSASQDLQYSGRK